MIYGNDDDVNHPSAKIEIIEIARLKTWMKWIKHNKSDWTLSFSALIQFSQVWSNFDKFESISTGLTQFRQAWSNSWLNPLPLKLYIYISYGYSLTKVNVAKNIV